MEWASQFWITWSSHAEVTAVSPTWIASSATTRPRISGPVTWRPPRPAERRWAWLCWTEGCTPVADRTGSAVSTLLRGRRLFPHLLNTNIQHTTTQPISCLYLWRFLYFPRNTRFPISAPAAMFFQSTNILWFAIRGLFFRYDATRNEWCKIAPMKSRRLGVSVCVYNGCIYAVGGSNGESPLNSVERYGN